MGIWSIRMLLHEPLQTPRSVGIAASKLHGRTNHRSFDDATGGGVPVPVACATPLDMKRLDPIA